MATRPAFIDIPPRQHGSSSLPSPRPLTSPRLHIAGDVPPELSPLDAFAAQSRLLFKQLEGSVSGGKRMSRLPPLTIESSFTAAQPGVFRSISADDSKPTMPQQLQSSSPGIKTELEASPFRPVSVYPLVSSLPPSRAGLPSPRLPFQDEEEKFRGRQLAATRSDFGARVDQSPSPLGKDIITRHPDVSPHPPRGSTEAISPKSQPGQTAEFKIATSRNYDAKTFVPPRSPFALDPAIRSASVDSDEDHVSIAVSEPQELFGRGTSTSPILLPYQTIPRSPSVHSDISTSRSHLSRPAFNFSRPLSRASESPATDQSPRQSSADIRPYALNSDAVQSEEFQVASNTQLAAPSYVYSRFPLPRSKTPRKDSENFEEASREARDQTMTDHNHAQIFRSLTAPSSPSFSAATSHLEKASSISAREVSTSASTENYKFRSNSQSDRNWDSQIRNPTIAQVDLTSLPLSLASGGAITAMSQHSKVSTDFSAEEHVTKGIECHERGSLKESTYHLRIAARQNHPTGMLLYALACRHGWGMRPNQRDGVQWLRKAAESAFSGVAEDDNLKNGHGADILEQKTRKAQFALSIYELGISHMNGWGIEQDKALALRCFEIAGAWGDGDALAEAGLCYAQGIGCKKDLKKSANFYRLAETKGISMIGNSWIHKSKYKDNTQPVHLELPEKKIRSKSHARTMFGKTMPNS